MNIALRLVTQLNLLYPKLAPQSSSLYMIEVFNYQLVSCFFRRPNDSAIKKNTTTIAHIGQLLQRA